MDGVGRIGESTITRTQHTHKYISNHNILQCADDSTRTVSLIIQQIAGGFTLLVLFGFPMSLGAASMLFLLAVAVRERVRGGG